MFLIRGILETLFKGRPLNSIYECELSRNEFYRVNYGLKNTILSAKMTIHRLDFIVGKMMTFNEAFKLIFTDNELLRDDIKEIYNDNKTVKTTWDDFKQFIENELPKEDERWSAEQIGEMNDFVNDIRLQEYDYSLGEECLSALQVTHDVNDKTPVIVGLIVGHLDVGKYRPELDFGYAESRKLQLGKLGWGSRLYVVQDDCNCCT